LVGQLESLGQYFEAIEWAEGSNQGASIFRRWYRADPTDAAGWLEASGLSAGEIVRLREEIQQVSRQRNP
jgi:hypothetical protein